MPSIRASARLTATAVTAPCSSGAHHGHADRRAVEGQAEALLGRPARLAEHVLAGDVDPDADDVGDLAVVVGEV